MEFKRDDYRVVLGEKDNPLAVKGLVPAPEGGYYLGHVFRMNDKAWDERNGFLRVRADKAAGTKPFKSELGDTSATNLKRLEALQQIVSAAMHQMPELHDIHDVRDLPAYEDRPAEEL